MKRKIWIAIIASLVIGVFIYYNGGSHDKIGVSFSLGMIVLSTCARFFLKSRGAVSQPIKIE